MKKCKINKAENMRVKFNPLVLLFVLFINFSYSQTKTNKYGATLWIKGKEVLAADESKLAGKSGQIDHHFPV